MNNWRIYSVKLRLRTPLHIGEGKAGNVLRTRGYVAGRNIWGALTERTTRTMAEGNGPATDSVAYRVVGDALHEAIAYTYFYPAWQKEDGLRVAWPWLENTQDGFLASYVSTALTYPAQSAQATSLHEVEMITPRARDSGTVTHLWGYVFERGDKDVPNWKEALNRLQLGGERTYGWGLVEPIGGMVPTENRQLFNGLAKFTETNGRPGVVIQAGEDGAARVLAHTEPGVVSMRGHVEPLVGREWRSDNDNRSYAGQTVVATGVYYRPGSTATAETVFSIEPYGIWRPAGEG